MFCYRYKPSDLKTDNPDTLNVLFQPNSLSRLNRNVLLRLGTMKWTHEVYCLIEVNIRNAAERGRLTCPDYRSFNR